LFKEISINKMKCNLKMNYLKIFHIKQMNMYSKENNIMKKNNFYDKN